MPAKSFSSSSSSGSKQKKQQQRPKQSESATDSSSSSSPAAAITVCPKTGDLLVSLHVRPGAARASESAVVEAGTGRLCVSVAAPPVDGQANAAVAAYLAGALRCRKTDVSLQAGGKSRDKVLRVAASAGHTVATAMAALVVTPSD